MSNDENNSNDNLAFILLFFLGGGFNTTKLVIKSQKTATIVVEKPLINAQSIMHNFVAKAAPKILEAAFIMQYL
jgi:hypothetical protein